MSVIQAILLGILQGIAEFLPISSSGHLSIVQNLFKLEDVPLLYDVMLHLATLFAVVLYFRKKIWNLLCVLFRWILKKERTIAEDDTDYLSGTDERGRKTIIAIILTTIVTGVLGILASKLINDDKISLKIVSIGFLITAFLLIASSAIEKIRNKKNFAKTNDSSECSTIKWHQALVIGLLQGIGTFPGISRSGSTISGAIFCKVPRTAAGEYSFIASIPAILGAFILEAKDLDKVGATVGVLPVIVGCVASFIFGYIALSLLMKVISKGKLEWFSCYLIPLGIFGLAVL